MLGTVSIALIRIISLNYYYNLCGGYCYCFHQIEAVQLAKIELNFEPSLLTLEPNHCTTIDKERRWDFPDGPLIKNPPVNAADIGLIPGQERFHLLRGN